MRRVAFVIICLFLIGLSAGCKKETLPDPAADAEAFYRDEVKKVDSQLVQERLRVATLGESVNEYPELEELFLEFIGAYLDGIKYRILTEETIIDVENRKAELIVEISCFSPQELYNTLKELRNQKHDEIMTGGVMPSNEELQEYFYTQGIELMKNDEVERIEGGYQHVLMAYNEQTGRWQCTNEKTLIENLLP